MKKLTKQQIDSMYKDGRFTKFENNIMLKIILDCGSSCAILYMVLLMHKNNNNPHGCYPTYETLMMECSIGSKATLSTQLSKLVEFGYIKIKSGNRSGSSQYYFPLAHNSINNYTEEDYIWIESVTRKKGTQNKNISNNSLNNLKGYKPQYDNDLDESPF
jgi:hypothetical protein